MMHTPPSAWRSKPSKYRFEGSRCGSCKSAHFPARDVCSCGGRAAALRFSGAGTIESFTVIRNAPHGFTAPYAVGIVRTEEGPSVPAQLVGPVGEMKIGAPVSLCVRRVYEVGEAGILVFGFKFEVE